MNSKSSSRELFLQFVVLALATIPIRLWELERYPEFIGWEHTGLIMQGLLTLRGDEHWTWINAFNFINGAYLNNLTAFLSLSDFVAVSTLLFGYNLFAAKLVPTLFGVLGVFSIFFFIRRWFDGRVGFIAAFLMATAPEMIGLSRDLHACLVYLVPYSILTLHSVMLTLERPTKIRFVFALSMMFYAFHLYHAAYILPMVGLSVWVSRAWKDPQWGRSALRAALIALPVASIFLVPLVYYQLNPATRNMPGRLYYHMAENSIPGKDLHEKVAQAKENFLMLWNHLVWTGEPLWFNHGIGDYALNSRTALLPHLTIFFTIGFIATIRVVKRSEFWWVAWSLLLWGLIPAVCSLPLSRRLVVFDTAIFIFAGYGVVATWKLALKFVPLLKSRLVRLPLLGISFGAAAFSGFITYQDLARAQPPFGERVFSERAVKALQERTTIYAPFDIAGIIDMVEYFSAAFLTKQETHELFLRPLSKNELSGNAFRVSTQSKEVMLALRWGIITQSACTYDEAVEVYSEGLKSNLRWRREDIETLNDRYFLITVPIADFSKLEPLLYKCVAG